MALTVSSLGLIAVLVCLCIFISLFIHIHYYIYRENYVILRDDFVKYVTDENLLLIKQKDVMFIYNDNSNGSTTYSRALSFAMAVIQKFPRSLPLFYSCHLRNLISDPEDFVECLGDMNMDFETVELDVHLALHFVAGIIFSSWVWRRNHLKLWVKTIKR